MSISPPPGRSIEGACDSHVHVLDPHRFPYAADRTYTPAPATVSELEAFMHTTGAQRVVLVQPSVYGTDNSALLDALIKLGPRTGRGVAVIDSRNTSDDCLAALHANFVRALRVNVAVNSDTADALTATIQRAAPFGFGVEIYADMTFVSRARDIIEKSPVPIILDHFAGIDIAARDNGLRELTQLLQLEHVWVKLSAPYRLPGKPSLTDVERLAAELISTRNDRLVWASDWPHTGRLPAGTARTPESIDPFHSVDNHAVLAALERAAGSPDVLHRILVDNPAELFDFHSGITAQ